MTAYNIFKENYGKTEHQFIGSVDLMEDDRIVIRKLNTDGLSHDVVDLVAGTDIPLE